MSETLMTSALLDVENEVRRASAMHPPFSSAHEAYAVILEELDEFKAEVWKRKSFRDRQKMREELTQVAAMAVRTIVDLDL